MKKALVTIHAGQFSDEQIKRLEQVVKKHYAEQVTTEKTSVIWCIVPKGQAYTDYKPSQSSIVNMECPEGFPQQKRVALLEGIAHEWVAITGQHLDHLMLSLLEADEFQFVLDSNQQRLSGFGRAQLGAHIVFDILRSKLSRGFFSFNPNL